MRGTAYHVVCVVCVSSFRRRLAKIYFSEHSLLLQCALSLAAQCIVTGPVCLCVCAFVCLWVCSQRAVFASL